MDILDESIIWSTLGAKLTKVTYCILVFRKWLNCLVLMDLWKKKSSIISWSIFTDDLISHYGDIKKNTLFSQLINIRQKGPIIEHIQQFQKLGLKVKNIHEGNLLDLFMGTLKENIQNEVCLFELKSLDQDFNMERKV